MYTMQSHIEIVISQSIRPPASARRSIDTRVKHNRQIVVRLYIRWEHCLVARRVTIWQSAYKEHLVLFCYCLLLLCFIVLLILPSSYKEHLVLQPFAGISQISMISAIPIATWD